MSVDLYESKNLSETLRKVGYIGSWRIDYTADRVQADGRVGTVFGIAPAKMIAGVALSQLEAAYDPEDLDMMKRKRHSMMACGGRTRLRYRLRYGEDQDSTYVESAVFVTLDRDGRLKEACGTLMDIGALRAMEEVSMPKPELDNLASHLLEAARIARQMHLSSVERGLRPALVMVGRMIAIAMPNLRQIH